MPSLQPVDAGFLDSAPNRVVQAVTVKADRSAAWAAIVDQPGWADWFPGISSVDAEPAVWTAPGDTRTVVVNRIRVQEEAIVVDPESEWGFTIRSWPLPGFRSGAEAIRLSDADDGGTTLTYVGAFELNLLGKLLWPGLRRSVAKAWRAAFESLDERITG